MAAVKKIDKERIMDAAYNLVRKEGFKSLSARKLAKEAGCSTQPIYENFNDMGVIMEVTLARVNELLDNLKAKLNDREYADYIMQGIAVCEFANEERILFRYFTMDESEGKDLLADTQSASMLEEQGGFDTAAAQEIDRKMKNLIIGMAFLVNTGYIEFDRAKIGKDIENYLRFVKDNI